MTRVRISVGASPDFCQFLGALEDYNKNSVGDLGVYRRGVGFILLLSALTLSACGTPLDLLPRGLQPAMYRDYIDEQAKEENEKKEYGAYTRITNKVWKDNRTAEIIYLED